MAKSKNNIFENFKKTLTTDSVTWLGLGFDPDLELTWSSGELVFAELKIKFFPAIKVYKGRLPNTVHFNLCLLWAFRNKTSGQIF